MVKRTFNMQGLLIVSLLLGFGAAGCSSNDEKDEKTDAKQDTQPVVQTTPQGQWVPVQPNMVWVPHGTNPQQQPVPVYPTQPGVPQQYAPQSPGTNPGQYAAPAPRNNPWAVAPRNYRDRGLERHQERYATNQPDNHWQRSQVPQNRYRPLEEERYEEPRREQYRQPPQPAWSGAAPYDRPMGSSSYPGGYPGAATTYGPGYPAYGVSPYGASPYGYGGLPGTYGGALPGTAVVPAPGIW